MKIKKYAGMFDRDKVAKYLMQSKGPRSMDEFAEDSGISRSTLYRIRNGETSRPIELEVLERIYNSRHESAKFSMNDLLVADGLQASDDLDIDSKQSEMMIAHQALVVSSKDIKKISKMIISNYTNNPLSSFTADMKKLASNPAMNHTSTYELNDVDVCFDPVYGVYNNLNHFDTDYAASYYDIIYYHVSVMDLDCIRCVDMPTSVVDMILHRISNIYNGYLD